MGKKKLNFLETIALYNDCYNITRLYCENDNRVYNVEKLLLNECYIEEDYNCTIETKNFGVVITDTHNFIWILEFKDN